MWIVLYFTSIGRAMESAVNLHHVMKTVFIFIFFILQATASSWDDGGMAGGSVNGSTDIGFGPVLSGKPIQGA